LAAIRGRVLSGRGGPGFGASWAATGINSSAAAGANVTDPEAWSIGVVENAALPLGPYTTFRDQPVDATSAIIAYTRTGDANLDGLVNDDDVTILGATYAPGVPRPSWALGDFDYNGFVDDDDVTLLGVFYEANTVAARGRGVLRDEAFIVADGPPPESQLATTGTIRITRPAFGHGDMWAQETRAELLQTFAPLGIRARLDATNVDLLADSIAREISGRSASIEDVLLAKHRVFAKRHLFEAELQFLSKR
jgi:hypothetical protein